MKFLQNVQTLPFLALLCPPGVNVLAELFEELIESLSVNIFRELSQHEPVTVLHNMESVYRFKYSDS